MLTALLDFGVVRQSRFTAFDADRWAPAGGLAALIFVLPMALRGDWLSLEKDGYVLVVRFVATVHFFAVMFAIAISNKVGSISTFFFSKYSPHCSAFFVGTLIVILLLPVLIVFVGLLRITIDDIVSASLEPVVTTGLASAFLFFASLEMAFSAVRSIRRG
ncbi:MAG: hypothetical protein AAF763_12885 [Pseudomonadota bacterium]